MSILGSLLKNLLDLRFAAARGRRERDAVARLAPAVAAFNAREFRRAADLCVPVIAACPGSAAAQHLRGRALLELGAWPEARVALDAAVAADPELAEAQADLALALFRTGAPEAAEAACRRAVSLLPLEVRYRERLVEILEAAGREREMADELLMACDCAPERLDLLLKTCDLLDRKNRHVEMLRLARRAVAEAGETFEVLNCLAVALRGTDDVEGAVAACRQALQLRAGEPSTHITLGTALFELGRVDEALSAHRQALKLDPESPAARYNIALINLMRGRYREGWADFDERLNVRKNQSWRPCEPRWNGSSLRGRSILIMREQGLGDEIMYASCYPDVVAQAAQSFIECDPRLEKLFARSFPGATFMPLQDLLTREQSDPGVPVDVRSYAGSLPRHLRLSRAAFPAHRGYLKADGRRVDYWRDRLQQLGPGLKVGLSWRGGTAATKRRRRSFEWPDLLPLLQLPGICWINLQYGPRSEDLGRLARDHDLTVTDWPEAIDGDYDETAALVSALDLTVSVCTSVIHLAGALGQSVWIMAPHVPEWRYGLSSDTLPWYPAARLFRQPVPGDWSSVVASVRQALVDRLAAGPD